ncbi:RNA polymerase sigma factor [Paenibacillus sp. KS-LC4]|uniref:RNA polymerase sigma factor n=1 Tax=Paenibacillus sp. KS-LC4 TaxID=2979727 RepID=UPI0030CD12D9
MEASELERLITAVQAGETGLYAAVVQAFQQPLYHYCLRLLASRQDAEDAVQDIFVKAYEAIEGYTPKVHFSAWLYRIAYHHCLNLLRRQRLQKQWLRLFRPSEMTAASAEEEMNNRLYTPALAAALAKLSLEERNLLILRVFEEKSYAELGVIMGKSPDALKKRMSRMKQRIKQQLLEKGEEAWSESTSIMNTTI